MELVSLGKDMLQNIAEHFASYRIGQSVLRKLDRALWVVEKCARWAVPPPLDQDDRPQPELVRPLPWICFLMMLITLRVTRESISLFNLVMGKPPLRSADVVIFFQSKRRYLRTLKYQGNRMMRARTSQATSREPWYNSIYKMVELTMCFRRESNAYGNNNTTRVSNNDEVMVVKRTKHGQQEASTLAATESTMERLIEKMMVSLDDESDEDSCYTLTNVSSPKSDRSDFAESDPDRTVQDQTLAQQNGGTTTNGDEEFQFSPTNNITSTPEKDDKLNNHIDSKKSLSEQDSLADSNENASSIVKRVLENNISEIQSSGKSQIEKFRENMNYDSPNNSDYKSCDEVSTPDKRILTTKQVSENLILTEAQRNQRSPKKEHKIANGRAAKSVPKKKGPHRERLSNEASPARVLTSNNSF